MKYSLNVHAQRSIANITSIQNSIHFCPATLQLLNVHRITTAVKRSGYENEVQSNVGHGIIIKTCEFEHPS